MKIGQLISAMATAALCLGVAPAMAQTPNPASAPRTYECEANAHCNVTCSVDGEKLVQTGGPKTVTITPLAANNYLIELIEQNGHVQFAYLAGAKVACTLEGVTQRAGQ